MGGRKYDDPIELEIKIAKATDALDAALRRGDEVTAVCIDQEITALKNRLDRAYDIREAEVWE